MNWVRIINFISGASMWKIAYNLFYLSSTLPYFSSYVIYDALFYLFKGIPQYFGPLEINTDIGVLAGHSLLVTERDNVLKKSGHYVLKKAASVGYRSTTSRLLTSASTDESTEPSDTTKTTKQTKQRWSLQLFGVKVIKFIFRVNRLKLFSCFWKTESSTESTLRASQHLHEKRCPEI